MTTPRLFIVRHGETEWSLNGRHTGVSDIPLTANGEKRIRATGRALVGKNRLIVPKKLAHIYVSPRKRAQRTFELLHLDLTEPLPWQVHGPRSDEYDDSDGEKARRSSSGACEARIEVTEAVREWDYGDYEGITSQEIQARRAAQAAQGLLLPGGDRRRWDIWKDGCPGGESPADITARLDALIVEIRSKYHAPALAALAAAKAAKAASSSTTSTKEAMPVAAAAPAPAAPAAPAAPEAPEAPEAPAAVPAHTPGDVLIVAHGHILRALAMRWVGAALEDGPTFLMEAGGVGTLSYEHNSIDEPAILLGGSFSVDLPAEK